MKLGNLKIRTKTIEAVTFGSMQLSASVRPITRKQTDYLTEILVSRRKVSVQISQAERMAVKSMVPIKSFGYIMECSLDEYCGAVTANLRIVLAKE